MTLKTIVIIILSFFLCSCSLTPNRSIKDQPIIADHQHWLSIIGVEDQTQQGLTAYHILDDAFVSIASRIFLIRHAKHHVDLQYYIWNDDFIGRLMLSELLKAADRGVKIRLLIDDQNGVQLDQQFQALMQHPNFNIKIYNPYKYRNFRLLDYLFRTKKINRRMHNKLIIADGAIAVTGGRNISREYFDASMHFQFTDLDVLFFGSSVNEANQTFTTFWNDELSYAAQQLIKADKSVQLNQLRQQYIQGSNSYTDHNEKIKVGEHVLKQRFTEGDVKWSKAYFLADHPNKTRAKANHEDLLYSKLEQWLITPQQHLELVSAYFVPTARGTEYLTAQSEKGVKVRVLTNSLAANDVAIVHAFYKNYRKQLLKAGVEVYEFKPYLERSDKTWYEIATGNVIPAQNKNRSSLHAKFFDVDGHVFIGSFNFDPRSVNLNTEVGLMIESEVLQEEVSSQLDHYLPHIAYQLKLDEKGQLLWLEHTSDGVITHSIEPNTTRFQRFMINLISKTPFEGMV